MLVELVVRNLGVIELARIPFGPGMTALTGETGAGKTMLVDALRLLMGERADTSKVRPGAPQAEVEALFAIEGPDPDPGEWVVRRVVPAEGRSRSYINGSLATVAEVAELAARLLEVHGQHAQQALLDPRTQRDALDTFGAIDTTDMTGARVVLSGLRSELDSLGGDDRERERHIDLLKYQLDEIAAAAPREGEDADLDAEEDLLAGAVEYRAAASRALEMLSDDAGDAGGAALELVAQARAQLGNGGPFEAVSQRLGSLVEELHDLTKDLRDQAESIEPDHERLAEVRQRRHALVELHRKYGATTAEILEFESARSEELAALQGTAQRREELGGLITAAQIELNAKAEAVGTARRKAAPLLAAAIEGILEHLAMTGAKVEVSVEDSDQLPGAGEHVELRLAANRGAPLGPLAKVASGGELSRVMLALRLVLSGGPPTMVFDEVDAGIGGEAAVAVGRALADLGKEHQVLVVTHLAQVAACADLQISVEKSSRGDSAVTTAIVLDEEQRVIELSRMLSGQPDSDSARVHATELLAEVRR